MSAHMLELALQENLEEVAHALVIFGVDVVMPLLQPWDEFARPASSGFSRSTGQPSCSISSVYQAARALACCRWSQPAQPITSAGSASREQNG